MDKVDKDHLPMPLSNFGTSLSQATKMLNFVFSFNSSLKHFSVEGTETFFRGGGGKRRYSVLYVLQKQF